MGKLVGKIDDVEIVFLHYAAQEEAAEKWLRRCERINWDNLLIKFSQMNSCSEDDLRAFNAIPLNRKICFTTKPHPELSCAIHCSGFESDESGILNDTDRYAWYVDLEKWLNGNCERYELG